ncbi:flagellar biosynthesis protein [Trichococcus sp. K1Tr]|uniref:flagellar biosynthesis protein n=1 Tax=Trichococcus sp. K1Tr TaxID=3020847 RepID=UPI0023311A11|nr:flagellar biosynthesis protein [Trichococcus sp. K1Tr]MDB6353468.1 flagellar biosynthesis protein [Trichococcus sp. K1Tr]
MDIRANADIKRVEPLQQINKKQQVSREFQTIMQEALSQSTDDKGLKISNHAQKRLDQRGFSLAGEDMSNLSQAMDELNDKGSKNSLLFYKDMALIASIDNRTIITALNQNELDTVMNIDSTKFIKD